MQIDQLSLFWQVLIDLSVHDVDIINYLAGEIKQVYSQLIFSDKQEIYAQCQFQVAEGIKASSEFSWISPKKTRTIEIFGEKGMLKGDYQNQTVQLFENSDESEEGRTLAEGKISEGRVISYLIKKDEPLRVELKRFVDTIKGQAEVLVKPEEAKAALKVALGILKSGKTNEVIKIDDQREGFDVFMLSKDSARHLAGDLRKRFKFSSVNVSHRQYSWDKSKDRPKTRINVSMRQDD